MAVRALLQNKTPREQADIKGQEIAKIKSVPRTNVKFSGIDYDIQVVNINAIPGGANVFTNHGIPFSNGIGIAATSGLPVDNTALPAASSVTADLFYK